VNFFINSIRAINDEAGTYEIDFWLELFWQDSALEGTVIEDIRPEQLWDPKIEAINGQALTLLYKGYDNSFEPDTNIALYQRLSGTFYQKFNLEKFPFDQQWMSIDLESSEYPSNRLLLDFIDLDQATVYTEQASVYPIPIGKFVSSDVSLGEWSIAEAQIAQQIHVLSYDKSSWAQMCFWASLSSSLISERYAIVFSPYLLYYWPLSPSILHGYRACRGLLISR